MSTKNRFNAELPSENITCTHLIHCNILTGMDKTYQRGDLMPYGALIKLVPAHWSKGDDLNKNTRSCWYRPGFRWSPESGQSVIPKDLEKFEVIVLCSNGRTKQTKS